MTSEPRAGSIQDLSRRRFLRDSGLVLGFAAGPTLLYLSPGEARARGLPLAVLTAEHAATLEALAEALVPGARDAGIVHFIDQQLAAPPGDNLLMLKYLGVAPTDQAAFYRGNLDNVQALCAKLFDAPPSRLSGEQRDSLLARLAGDDTPGWQGAPASLFFFVLRSDGADVVYGTAAGLERLAMPRMAHIVPDSEW